MAGEVFVDALPYIDQGYEEPGVRDAAISMVEEECRRYRPTKNYLEGTVGSSVVSTAFETPMIKRELERVQQRQPMEPLSMKRYELPPPAPGRLSDLSAWTESVDNSHAQLQHQATRVVNLELQLDYGCAAWRDYLRVINAMVQRATNTLNDLRQEVTTINCCRKSHQMEAGARLRGLQRRWAQLVSDNYRTERAITELQTEIDALKEAAMIPEENGKDSPPPPKRSRRRRDEESYENQNGTTSKDDDHDKENNQDIFAD